MYIIVAPSILRKDYIYTFLFLSESTIKGCLFLIIFLQKRFFQLPSFQILLFPYFSGVARQSAKEAGEEEVFAKKRRNFIWNLKKYSNYFIKISRYLKAWIYHFFFNFSVVRRIQTPLPLTYVTAVFFPLCMKICAQFFEIQQKTENFIHCLCKFMLIFSRI